MSGLTSARKPASLKAPWTRSMYNQAFSQHAARGKVEHEGGIPKKKEKKKKRKEGNVPQTARRRRPSGERRSGSTYDTCGRAGPSCMIASLPRGMRSGLFASTARMRGARMARSVMAPARSIVASRLWSRSKLGDDGCDEASVMTPRVRCKWRGLMTMEGSSPSMGGSCASQEDLSAQR